MGDAMGVLNRAFCNAMHMDDDVLQTKSSNTRIDMNNDGYISPPRHFASDSSDVLWWAFFVGM